MSVAKLVEKYHKNRAAYLKPSYNETQLRADFLDPLFELLGWDIKNNQGKPTNEREVLLEESLKANANSNTKKPDYTFRLFSERKFFLEAKKPSVNIEKDDSPAKQVRRYGFTAKLKISILSNFEHLIIYDCSHKVNETDAYNSHRINIYHYTEYEDKLDEIKSKLGHQSVYSGEFDNVWKDIEAQLNFSCVDDLFLQQINEWRIILAEEILSHQANIQDQELNDIVQSYINSLIFLRVCEDRNLEDYKTLQKFANNCDYKALIQKFIKSDQKYNAGLFDHPLIEKIISDNKSAFWAIIKQLYYPESTYSFSVFASDILGNIYEIFLSEQLRVVDGSVHLEKKPENVDRDIVTTPTYIIRDILRQTVVKQCNGKTDQEILRSTFADIACGSGAFLLETYQLLHDTLVDYYLNNSPKRLIQTSINTYKLPFEIKKAILKNCIFGVDKDFNAVEACKFGLLLKLLEDEGNDSITLPALPNIDDNIQYGNSLIDNSMMDGDNVDVINPYDFGETKFDVIVGNPPYMATEHMKQITPLELPIYKKNYSTSYKQFDKYFLFIERSLFLVKEGGYLGYIVPSKFHKVGAGTQLRQLLRKSRTIEQIISFGANQIFHDKTTYTCLLILKNEKHEEARYFEVQNLNDWKIRHIADNDFDSIQIDDLQDDGWVLVPSHLKTVFEKINNQSKSLESLVYSDNIYNGIQTSANTVYVHKASKEDSKYFYFSKDGIDWKIEKILTRPYFITSRGVDNLNTYRPFAPNAFVIYPYLKTEDGIKFIEIDDLKTNYPCAYEYLKYYKDKLDNDKRDIKPEPETENEWYRYGRHQSLDKCDVPAKIIVGVLSQGNKYAIDYHGTLISSGGTAGYCMITLPEEFPYSIYYIQALLNSKYLEWYSALIGEVFRGGYIARGTKVLKKLPIRIINFGCKEDKLLHDEISKYQEELIGIQKEIDKHTNNKRKLMILRRKFDHTKSGLDVTLQKLYNLENDDSAIPLISEIYATH